MSTSSLLVFFPPSHHVQTHMLNNVGQQFFQYKLAWVCQSSSSYPSILLIMTSFSRSYKKSSQLQAETSKPNKLKAASNKCKHQDDNGDDTTADDGASVDGPSVPAHKQSRVISSTTGTESESASQVPIKVSDNDDLDEVEDELKHENTEELKCAWESKLDE
ncbi:uncharacterized protein ARMOST_19820 [Armillaria ostoyae]|uniref:Uncharacterized protein n=1 Tax=Armillaria ostoyae TaxID=47428 RepID=A0A284S5N4_ARMOS|nr:uncharacterized protein ARMOST_19820 [Armillaria ostoyae]